MNFYFQKYGHTFISDFVYSSYEGFLYKRDPNYKDFFFNEITEVPINKNNIVFGCIVILQYKYIKLFKNT